MDRLLRRRCLPVRQISFLATPSSSYPLAHTDAITDPCETSSSSSGGREGLGRETAGARAPTPPSPTVDLMPCKMEGTAGMTLLPLQPELEQSLGQALTCHLLNFLFKFDCDSAQFLRRLRQAIFRLGAILLRATEDE